MVHEIRHDLISNGNEVICETLYDGRRFCRLHWSCIFCDENCLSSFDQDAPIGLIQVDSGRLVMLT